MPYLIFVVDIVIAVVDFDFVTVDVVIVVDVGDECLRVRYSVLVYRMPI